MFLCLHSTHSLVISFDYGHNCARHWPSAYPYRYGTTIHPLLNARRPGAISQIVKPLFGFANSSFCFGSQGVPWEFHGEGRRALKFPSSTGTGSRTLLSISSNGVELPDQTMGSGSPLLTPSRSRTAAPVGKTGSAETHTQVGYLSP